MAIRLKIYTTMAVCWDRDKIQTDQGIKRRRLWGFFGTFSAAERAVLENWGDNFDEAGYYNGAIIEEVSEGYFDWDKEHRWFYRHRLDYKDGDPQLLEPMPEPPYFKNVVAITLG